MLQMSPRATFSPSRWSPDPFNQDEKSFACLLSSLKTEEINQIILKVGNCTGGSQTNVLGITTEAKPTILVSRRSHSPSPALSKSNQQRSRSRSRSRERRRESVRGSRWDRRFSESPPTPNSRRMTAVEERLRLSRSGTRAEGHNGGFCGSRDRDRAKVDRKYVPSYREARERGRKRIYSSEERNLDPRMPTQSKSNQGLLSALYIPLSAFCIHLRVSAVSTPAYRLS
jgi:hypothetical protein